MNHKQFVLIWGVFYITLFMTYACTHDEWLDEKQNSFTDLISGKNQELTIPVAKSWYSANKSPVTRMATVDSNYLGFLVSPSWNHAKEWRKGHYEVVEASLRSNVDVLFMDKETEMKKEDLNEDERKKVMNVGRTVILKDIYTAEIITFNMVVIGSHDYLMQGEYELSDNNYLYRDSNFDGTILFFHPDGEFVNGWKYKNGKIIKQLTPVMDVDESLYGDSLVMTRGYTDCHIEYDYYTYFSCPTTRSSTTGDWMTLYNDGEFGGDGGGGGGGWWNDDPDQTFPIDEVEIPGNCEWVTVAIPYMECTYDEDSGGSGGGYGGGTIAPKAKSIFRNSNMTDQNWQVIERMLDKIIENCMGEGLYALLRSKLNGNTLTIEFVEGYASSFSFGNGTSGIKLGLDLLESNILLHEMMHALQGYYETETSYRNAILNLEIEAHYAQYLYLKDLPEYKRAGNKWEDIYSPRLNSISYMKEYIDDKGVAIGDLELLDVYLEVNIIDAFQRDPAYRDLPYDFSRKRSSNFSVLNNITQNCD